MEEFKALFMKKDESEHRNFSIITAFEPFWTIKVPMHGTNQPILKWRVHQKQYVLHWDLEARNKINSRRNVSSNIGKVSTLTPVLWRFWTLKSPTQGTNWNSFSMQSSSTTKILSLETLMLEGGNLVGINGEFWVSISFVTTRSPTKMTKMKTLLMKTSLQVVNFRLKSWKKKSSIWWSKKQVWSSAHFGKIFRQSSAPGPSLVSKWFFERILLHKCNISDWYLQGRNWSCDEWDIYVWTSR